MKRTLIGIGIGVLLTVLIASGWIYNALKNNQVVEGTEIANLNASFMQQYGNNITFKQLVTPERIYAALGTDANGIDYVFVNIAGVWGVWWKSDVVED